MFFPPEFLAPLKNWMIIQGEQTLKILSKVLPKKDADLWVPKTLKSSESTPKKRISQLRADDFEWKPLNVGKFFLSFDLRD